MTRFLLLLLTLTLFSGCAVTLHGQQTSGGGSTSTTVGSSVRASAHSGNARVGASFGSAPAQGAPGGQLSFSRGASAVLVLAVLISGTVDVIAAWFSTPSQSAQRAATEGSISQTCSCYGWQPDAASAD